MLTLAIATLALGKPMPVSSHVSNFRSHAYHVVVADFRGKQLSASVSHAPRLTAVRNLLVGNPIAAITGTFFDPRSQITVGDVIVDGAKVSGGGRGSGVGIDWYGQVSIFDTSRSQPVDWSVYRYCMRGAIRILTNGKPMPNPKAQGFRDRRLWGTAARTALGTTRSGKVVLIATKSPVTLSELARAIQAQGAHEAVCLDGGGSTYLFCGGKTLVPTGRRLSNLFLIHDKPPY